jgi:hypothetical protein
MSLAAPRLLLFVAVGALAGAAYVRALAWNVRLYCRNAAMPLAISLHAARLLGVGAIFFAAAKAGAAPLLATFAGFQLIRIFIVRSTALREVQA